MAMKRGSLLLGLLAAVVSASPAFAATARRYALHGAEAATFQVPSDMQLLKTLPARGPRLSWERYQQHVGTAAVLGGQLTLLRDGTARAVAVIGRRSLGIVPANTVRLTPEQAAGLATREIRGGTAVAALLIDPRSGRYFYR